MYRGAKFLVKKSLKSPSVKVLPVNRIMESRMALKLDDLIGKKKEVAQVLDLANATANSNDEFKKVMEKVPEFRIKPEKIKPEDVRTFEKERKRSGRRKSRKRKDQDHSGSYQFADPVPEEMQGVKLGDLCPVNIQWNMLTTLRPKNKLDTEYFSRGHNRDKNVDKGKKLDCSVNRNNRRIVNERRLVELGKLELATQEKEKKITDESFKRKMKNRAGVVETRYLSCPECGEDFCQKETCTLFTYENFRREPIQETLGKKEESKRGRTLSKTKKKKNRSKSSKKRKGGTGGGSKSAERHKSKNRSISRTRGKTSGGRSTSRSNKTRGKSISKTRSPTKIRENKKQKKLDNKEKS